MTTRREFLKNAALGAAALSTGMIGPTARSYSRIAGANDRLRIGLIGFSDRARDTLIPCFLAHARDVNAEITAISDIWKRRREEGGVFLRQESGTDVALVRNNEELFEKKLVDAVIISTADFQHALHGAAAVRAGLDAYIEKPLAESMADAREVLKAVRETNAIVQVGPRDAAEQTTLRLART